MRRVERLRPNRFANRFEEQRLPDVVGHREPEGATRLLRTQQDAVEHEPNRFDEAQEASHEELEQVSGARPEGRSLLRREPYPLHDAEHVEEEPSPALAPVVGVVSPEHQADAAEVVVEVLRQQRQDRVAEHPAKVVERADLHEERVADEMVAVAQCAQPAVDRLQE